MKILVTGGRDYNNGAKVYNILDHYYYHAGGRVHLIMGGARGADSWAQRWAEEREVVHTVYPARWREFGRRAGMLRNSEMAAERPDLVVAFPGGAGTANMVSLAQIAGIPVHKVDN